MFYNRRQCFLFGHTYMCIAPSTLAPIHAAPPKHCLQLPLLQSTICSVGLSCSLFSSHFHLDHCGALPYMSEMVGFDGPIYMTHPTKAICPILLEDYRKITVDKKGETNFFTSQMIKDCMKKVVAVNLHQTVQVSGIGSLRNTSCW